jgi:hypothetical protein
MMAVNWSGIGNFITQKNGETIRPPNPGSLDLTYGRCYMSGGKGDTTENCANVNWKPLPMPYGLTKINRALFYTNMELPYSKDDVVNVLDAGVENTGNWDQAAAINQVLKDAARANKWVFFPAGIYQVMNTVYIPRGSRIVGEAWPQISGYGQHFQDEKKPRPVVQVGGPGEVGRAQIYGMIFTTRESTPGAVIIEWNIKAYNRGEAGMWDSVIRAGGTAASGLDIGKCGITWARRDRPEYQR